MKATFTFPVGLQKALGVPKQYETQYAMIDNKPVFVFEGFPQLKKFFYERMNSHTLIINNEEKSITEITAEDEELVINVIPNFGG